VLSLPVAGDLKVVLEVALAHSSRVFPVSSWQFDVHRRQARLHLAIVVNVADPALDARGPPHG
jgi:hypothetical protein